MARLRRLDNGQRLQVEASCPQTVAAALEAFLHSAANTHQLGACGIDNVAQAPHGFAVGHEVVDDEHLVFL